MAFDGDDQISGQFEVDTRSTLAALGAQVRSIEGDYSELKVTVTGIDRKLEHGIASVKSEFAQAMSALTLKLDEKQRPQWQVWSIGVTVIIALSALAYLPIRDGLENNKNRIISLERDLQEMAGSIPKLFVSQAQRNETMQQVNSNTDKINRILQDLPNNYVNYREHDRLIKQTENEVTQLRNDQVTRAEHKNLWEAQRERENDIRHRLEQLRTDFGGVWSSRDEIQRLQTELRELQRMLKPHQS